MTERESGAAFRQAVELIGRRWCGAIARVLLDGPRYFSELARAIPDISPRSLSQRLKELEAEGILVRRVETASPVRVRYELTAKGRSLEGVLLEVERWAEAWVEQEPGADERVRAA